MSNGDDDDARANDGADDAKATGDATGDANAGDGDNRRTARDGARATREGDDGEDARPRGKRPDISNLVSVKIDNVSYELREEDLREAFEKFGDARELSRAGVRVREVSLERTRGGGGERDARDGVGRETHSSRHRGAWTPGGRVPSEQ